MKSCVTVIAGVIALLCLNGCVILRAQRRATDLPVNSPAAYLETAGTAGIERFAPVVVCVGDSITHGAV